MKNTKHILMTVLIVSTAILSVVCMPVFQPESTNTELSDSKPWNKQGDIARDNEYFRKGVLVDYYYSKS